MGLIDQHLPFLIEPRGASSVLPTCASLQLAHYNIVVWQLEVFIGGQMMHLRFKSYRIRFLVDHDFTYRMSTHIVATQ